MTRRLCFVGVGLSLLGCAQPNRETFDLAGAALVARASAKTGPALAVREPTAAAPTSGDRIVVRDLDGSVSILPGVQWSERLTRLLQTRMIELLQNAGIAAAKLSGNMALATDIVRFEIDVARDVAVVEINARLLDERDGASRAAQRFTVESPSPDHTGAPATLALADAARTALARIAVWARGRL